jgi:predicted RNA-binding Zn-ribbon protein involved in translation (DUF1610 family)
MKCPYCGKAELPSVPYKKWKYRKGYYEVKAYECPNCGKKQFSYYHERQLQFTIPKKNIFS